MKITNWADRVLTLRKRLGLSRDQFARKLDARSIDTIRAWEKGWWLPNAEAQTRIEDLERETG